MGVDVAINARTRKATFAAEFNTEPLTARHRVRIRMLSLSDHVTNARFMGKIAVTLANAGHDVQAWVQGSSRPSFIPSSVRLVLMGDVSKSRRFLMFPRALRWALSRDYDLLIVDSPDSVLIGVIAKLFGKKVIWDIVEVYEYVIRDAEWIPPKRGLVLSKIFRVLEWVAMHTFDGVMDSEEAYEVRSRSARRRIFLRNYPWYPGSTDETKGEHALKRWFSSGPRLIYIGMITTKHGLDDTIKAIRLLERDLPDITLDIIGPISRPELRDRLLALREQLDDPTRVTLHGIVPFDRIREHYGRAQIAVFPLWKLDNFTCSETTKLFEYSLYGLPMVVGDVPAWRRLSDQADSGEVFEPQNPRSMADAILRLWARGRDELEAASRRACEVMFQRKAFWEKDAADMLKLIDEVVGEREG